jgi:hypothetical protein
MDINTEMPHCSVALSKKETNSVGGFFSSLPFRNFEIGADRWMKSLPSCHSGGQLGKRKEKRVESSISFHGRPVMKRAEQQPSENPR